jgi:hypothetical protein
MVLLQYTKYYRDYLKIHNPTAKIIWQFNPHVGNLDERSWHFPFQDMTRWHDQGKMWSHINCVAKWPILNNYGLKYIAKQCNDLVLDVIF